MLERRNLFRTSNPEALSVRTVFIIVDTYFGLQDTESLGTMMEMPTPTEKATHMITS